MYGHFEIAGSLLGYVSICGKSCIIYVSTHPHTHTDTYMYIYIHTWKRFTEALLLKAKDWSLVKCPSRDLVKCPSIKIGNILYVCAILKYLVFSQ